MTKQEQAKLLLDKIEETHAAFHAFFDAIAPIGLLAAHNRDPKAGIVDKYHNLRWEKEIAEMQGRRFIQEQTSTNQTCIWVLKAIINGDVEL